MWKLKEYLLLLFGGMYILCLNSFAFSMPIADAEIELMANKLVRAVKERNESALVELSRSEFLYEGQLAPNTREFIFGKEGSGVGEPDFKKVSICGVLCTAKNVDLLIEKFHGTWQGKRHEFARVYFFDPSKIKLKLPINAQSGKLWMNKFVTCRFVKVNGSWLVAYTLFDDETDGPLAFE